MKGALPPSSSDSFFKVLALWAISFLPTEVEPVKVILRTVGLEVISPPIATASRPVTKFSTPAGMPARAPNSAIASAEKGVCEAGLQTKVHPAASAGAAFRVIIAAGKFH